MNFDRVFRTDSRTRERISKIHSGYNDFNQRIRESDEDIFFFEIDFSNEHPGLSCQEVLRRVVSDLDRSLAYTVLNNGSSESSYLISLLKEAQIQFQVRESSQRLDLDSKLAEVFFEKYRIDSPELFGLAQIARTEKRALLCPQFSFRVINALAGSENEPYWTYVENERFHLFDQFCQETELEIIWNWFRCSADFYPAYFNSNLESFLKEHSKARNNVAYDSQALMEASPALNAAHPVPVSQEIQKLRSSAKRMAQASHPLHLLYQKLGRQSELNSKYRELYGA